MLTVPIITIDGPSGVGKGTLSKALATQRQWHLLDSGAIYRVLALACLNKQCDLSDEHVVVEIAQSLQVEFHIKHEQTVIYLEGEEVSEQIRAENVGVTASKIAVYPNVRTALLERQRAFAKAPGLIADGRDMGTIVFPDAPVKIFLDASLDERARRRYNQLQNKGISAKLGCLLTELEQRDQRDRNRSIAPLVPAKDALIIDSTHLSINEVIQVANQYIQERLG